MDTVLYFIFAVAGFISGSIMYSYLVAKYIYGVNIIEEGEDHNPGMTNVMNCVNKRVGVCCLVLDLVKGFLPVFVANLFVDFENPLFSIIVLAPVLGHAFSPTLKFKGGKAIAVTYGVLLALSLISHNFIVLLLALSMAFFSLIIVITPHSLRVISSMVLFVISSILLYREPVFILSSASVAIVVIYKHITNYGTEKGKVRLIFKHK